MTFKEQYEICKVRKHQQSGQIVDGWHICKFCETWFKYITEMVEKNAPAEV